MECDVVACDFGFVVSMKIHDSPEELEVDWSFSPRAEFQGGLGCSEHPVDVSLSIEGPLLEGDG